MERKIADPQIQQLLQTLLTISKEELQDNFFGMYVFGSLVSGDYNPETSDIDFVVITNTDVSSLTATKLTNRIEDEVFSHPLSHKLEGSFLPLRIFQSKNVEPSMYLSISTGNEIGYEHKGIEQPVQKKMLRDDGKALEGPEAQSFIEPIGDDELTAAVLDVLHSWWEPQLTDDHRLRDREYQAYAVVTMCRMLVTLQSKEIISKPKAAQQIMTQYPQWSGLISRANNWQKNDNVDDVEETKEFIRFVLQSKT